jgi:hypothetical protein
MLAYHTLNTIARYIYAVVTWVFYPGVDSAWFGDLQNRGDLAGNVTALKEACDAFPGCEGFNLGNWLKGPLRPMNQWTAGPGLYVRIGEPLPHATWYLSTWGGQGGTLPF